MNKVVLIISIIASIIHLVASYQDNKPLRNASKGFIVSFLAIYYVLSVESFKWTVMLALFFSWLGDMLLIPKGVKWFTIGGISFMISHFFFVLSYNEFVDFTKVPFWLIAITAAIYTVLVVKVFKGLKPHLPKPLFYPMFLYLLINGTMNAFSIFQMVSQNFTSGSIVTFIGALLFFISDSTLFYVRFKKDSVWKNHFLVMLTYILAEFMILAGIMMA